jgi:hypothetical protein
VKRRISTLLLLLCWLFATALAGLPAWHEWLHGADAGHGDHECVVTLIANGGLDSPVAQPIIVSAPVMMERSGMAVQDSDVPAIFLGGGLSDRGPPVVAA